MFCCTDAIENIDIGGPSMLRSAAKNHESVTVVVDPLDYAEAARQISENGNTTLELRRELAAKVFARTAAYDGAIAAHLQKEFGVGQASRLSPASISASSDLENSETGRMPVLLSISAPLVQPLRYGENPHQAAALYGKFSEFFQQLHGKELSYNNILDLTAAASLISEFEKDAPTLAILKHTNPCGGRPGRDFARGLGQGVCDGQAGAVRRNHRDEQNFGRRLRRGDCGNFQRGDRRAGFFDGGFGNFAEEEKSAADKISPKCKVQSPRRL